jgi:hypothetical protein
MQARQCCGIQGDRITFAHVDSKEKKSIAKLFPAFSICILKYSPSTVGRKLHLPSLAKVQNLSCEQHYRCARTTRKLKLMSPLAPALEFGSQGQINECRKRDEIVRKYARK